MMIEDFPKLECPFVREMVGNKYLVTEKVAPGYEWVFEDDSVWAEEKLHGTNVSIIIEKGKITRIFNRTGEVPFFGSQKRFIVEAVMNSYDRGYCNFTDGQYFGEVVGPKLHGNPYLLQEHLWISFDQYTRKNLSYKSWGKYPKTFDSIKAWFEDLMPLFSLRNNTGSKYVEGVVFKHPDGSIAKLRKDMFPGYSGEIHKGGFKNAEG